MKDIFVYVPDIKFAIRLLLKYFSPAIILVHMKKSLLEIAYIVIVLLKLIFYIQ